MRDIKNGLLWGLIIGGLVLGWIFIDKYEWRYWLPYWAFFGLFAYANIRKEEKPKRKRSFQTFEIKEDA